MCICGGGGGGGEGGGRGGGTGRWFWRGRFEEEGGEKEEEEEEEEEQEEEEQEEQEEGEGGVEEGEEGGEEELTRRHTFVRTLYQRALRLLPPPTSLPPALPPALPFEREEVYLALLEGAEQYVEMTRFLLRRRRGEGGREGGTGGKGWKEALGVLDRLREEGKKGGSEGEREGGREGGRECLVAARHGVFVFLLEAALRGEGGREGGREADEVMRRRPLTLQAQDVRLIARQVLEDEWEEGEGGGEGGREGRVERAVLRCVEILEGGGKEQGEGRKRGKD